MKPNRISAALLLALVLGITALSAPPARADWDDHDRAREALRRGDILPLNDILDRVQARIPGRFLEVELEHEHGALLYEIKILDDRGRVTRLKVDAATGEILKRRTGGDD